MLFPNPGGRRARKSKKACLLCNLILSAKIKRGEEDMADKSQAHDKQVLHKLGYAQELSRRMSGFSNFAISFSIICILAGGISSFSAAFNVLGGGGAFVILVVGGILALSVGFG